MRAEVVGVDHLGLDGGKVWCSHELHGQTEFCTQNLNHMGNTWSSKRRHGVESRATHPDGLCPYTAEEKQRRIQRQLTSAHALQHDAHQS
jgi:hypothetical protein